MTHQHPGAAAPAQAPPTHLPSRKLQKAILRHAREKEATRKTKDAKKRKPRTKQQERNQRPPTFIQIMTGVLAYLVLELNLAMPGLLMNRYGIFSPYGGASNMGYSADIMIAIVRIIDRLRMDHARSAPEGLKQLADGDNLTVAQLLASYPAWHPIWTLDVSAFKRINLANFSGADFAKALVECICANFKFIHLPLATEIWSNPEDCKEDTVRGAVARAIENREERLASPSEPQLMVRCAGWTEATQTTRDNNKEHSRINRMIQIKPKTCVKGGSHV